MLSDVSDQPTVKIMELMKIMKLMKHPLLWQTKKDHLVEKRIIKNYDEKRTLSTA